MTSRNDRGGSPYRDTDGRQQEEDRFQPVQGSEGLRSRGGRSGGSDGEGYRYQGADAGTFGSPGGGYGEYNWERGGDFGQSARGREEYNRWGDELGRGRERSSWQGSGARGDYDRGDAVRQETPGASSSSRYGFGGTSGYDAEGYRSRQYGSAGQSAPSSRPIGREGAHYGKGPKGYTRSDERLRDEVSDRLTEDATVDASSLSVSVKDGEVTLEGTVDDRHMKRRAEDVAEGVSGVRQVHNMLRVEPQGQQIGNRSHERGG